jgi:hypothetical protein
MIIIYVYILVQPLNYHIAFQTLSKKHYSNIYVYRLNFNTNVVEVLLDCTEVNYQY